METPVEPLNLASQLKDEHQGKWIAYSPEELKIYAYSEELNGLLQKIKELKKEGLTIQKVLRSDIPFIS